MLANGKYADKNRLNATLQKKAIYADHFISGENTTWLDYPLIRAQGAVRVTASRLTAKRCSANVKVICIV